jgi:WD40 repeat protein
MLEETVSGPTVVQAKTCPQCGGSIPSDAPGGFCPRCALTCGLKCGLPETPGSPEAGALPAIRYFGDYELLEEIGRGGMGVVYRARQLTLNRTVAVKMILASRLATPAEVDLFRAEARTAGRLHHPGIVGIHEVGEHEGQHYFSMDYVEGQSLAHAVRDGPLAASRAAHYLRDIAQAVQHAHSQGILHRDLKPSNILLDAADRPRVTDFGLAKQLSGRAELTLSGQILGSPNFMPPEQAAGKRARVGPYSDVYSLGAILYQMLTGRPPFVAETLTATLHQVMNADPVAPRILNPSVPRDLETICLKCLNKEPGKRYATADALADELDRFLRSEPIVARPLSRAAKAWRWCRRKPVLAGWIAISLLLLASGTSGVLWQWRRAVTGERVAQQNLYAADMNLVQQALSENNLGRATELLARHLPVRLASASQLAVTGDDLRGWEWRYLWECCRTDELFVLGQHSGRIVGIAFSPDGRHLASADSDGKVQLWDLMSRKTLASIEYARYVSGIAFSPDGRHLACAGLGVPAIVLNVPTLTRSFAAGRSHRAMTFADGGKALYTDQSGTLQRWDVESGLLTWQSASNDVFRLPGINPQAAFSPDGAKFAVGTFERGARVWDVQSAAEMASFPREGDEFLFRLAFSPDGGTLATGHTDGTVTLWALSGGQRRLRTLGGHTSWITALAFSPDGTRLASGSYDHAIVVWDTTTGQKLTWLKGHEDEVDALAFSPDGRKLASGSKDQSIRLWDLTRPRAAESWKRFPSPSFPCVLSPDGSTALVRDLDRGFVAWNISSFTPLAPPISGSNLIVGAVSALGRHVALAPRLGSIQLYAYNDGTLAPVGELSVGTNPIAAVAYSALENVLAAFSENGRVMLWDTESKSPIKQFQHFTNMSGSLSFLGDGRWLGIRYAENLGEIFDVTNRRRVALFKGHRGSVMDIAVSHNRRLAATGGFDHTVKLWRMTGADGATELATLKGHLTPVWSVAFSRDDTRLAAGLGGGEIRIWNVEALQEVATLRGHRLPVTALHFTASDETLVSVSGDSLRVWKAPPLAEIDRQAASRSTTPETSLDDSPR